MLFVRTKIQFFESKSQLSGERSLCPHSCSSEQRYNFLKANHNSFLFGSFLFGVVRQNKDTIFWKQITTNAPFIRNYGRLFVRTKIQFFESKSQLNLSMLLILLVVRQNKDTIFWKQITTKFHKASIFASCSSEQRYNFLKANHNNTALLSQPK